MTQIRPRDDPLPDGTARVYVCSTTRTPRWPPLSCGPANYAATWSRACIEPHRSSTPLGDALDVFGILDAACRGDTPSTNALLMPWRDLPTHLRQSNYAQVERIGAKLREIGAALATSQPAELFAFRD